MQVDSTGHDPEYHPRGSRRHRQDHRRQRSALRWRRGQPHAAGGGRQYHHRLRCRRRSSAATRSVPGAVFRALATSTRSTSSTRPAPACSKSRAAPPSAPPTPPCWWSIRGLRRRSGHRADVEVRREHTISRCMFHINKMDRENSDFERVLGALGKYFKSSIGGRAPDADRQRARLRRRRRPGRRQGLPLHHKTATARPSPRSAPAELADAIEEWRNKLIEGVAETDDELMEHYFDEGDAHSTEELRAGLQARRILQTSRSFPSPSALPSTASAPVGFLDTVVDYLPAPSDRWLPSLRPISVVSQIEISTDRRRPAGQCAGVQDPERPVLRQDLDPAGGLRRA